MSGKRMQ